MATDPVCNMEVEPSEAAASYNYEGKTYYFCHENCREEFAASPDKFVGSEDSE